MKKDSAAAMAISSPGTGDAVGTAPDDWDSHWGAFGEALAGSPANGFRIRLALSLLTRPLAGSVVLDIGSGQGEFAVYLKRLYPDLTIWGAEYSARGVELGRVTAKASGLDVKFRQADLLQPVTLEAGQPPAQYAVCSEVLEHVEDPVRLLRNSMSLLAPGCRVVITVPGGPRSAFDKHIGHHRHFTAAALRGVLTDAGYRVERVVRAGFPVFNLYKLAIIARGERFITDVADLVPGRKPSMAELATTRVLDTAFKYTIPNFPLGWQLAAAAYVPGEGPQS